MHADIPEGAVNTVATGVGVGLGIGIPLLLVLFGIGYIVYRCKD